MDDVGNHLCDLVQDNMSKGLRPRLIFDVAGSGKQRQTLDMSISNF